MKNRLSNVMMTSLIALLHIPVLGQQAQAACVEVVMGTKVTATCTGTTASGFAESAIANNTVVNVSAGATVSAPAMGWAVQVQQGLDAVNNDGTISGGIASTGGVAKFSGNDFVLTNHSTINATATGVLVKDGTGDTIDNRGTITTTVGHAIDVQNDAVAIKNTSTGTISGANTAISVTSGSRGILVENSGVIQTTKVGNSAIKTLDGDDTIANLAGGNITGNIDLGNGKNIIGNDGAIYGNITTGGGNDTLTNTGTGSITNGNINLGGGSNVIDNTGVITAAITTGGDVDNLTNGGKITGGINLGDGVNKITNSNTGSITGNIATGMNNDTLENQGTITGDIGLGDGVNKITNSNTGSITGNIATGMDNDTLENQGTITGDINLGAGANKVTNYSTAKIEGSYTGGAGNDTILNYGRITKNIDMGDGDDLIGLGIGMTLDKGVVIEGGLGNDRLVLTGGTSVQSQKFDNEVKNVEILTKESLGTWELGRDYNFATKVDVEQGHLRLANNIKLTTANLNISSAAAPQEAVFSGSGSVAGNVNINNKGILRPGDGVSGTLQVTRNVTVNAFGSIEVGVGPGVVQSKLDITGDLNLNGNGTLQVSVASGLYKATTLYDVITLGGTRNGEFGTVNLPTGTRFTRFKVNYLPKAVQVEVEKLNYNTVGMTYNQREAGDGLYRGMVGSVAGSDMEAVAGAFEGLPNDEAMQRALDSLSGVEWASMGEVRGGVSRSFRGVGMGRVGMMSEGMGVWGQLLQGRNDVEGDGNGAGIKGKVQGLVGGMEYGFGVGKVGVMVGYGDGQMKLSGMGEGKVEMVMGGVYGGWSFGGIEVEGGVSYGEGKQRVERQIGVGGVQRRVEGGEKVREFGGNVGIGYGIKLGMIEITPSVGFEVVRYEEKGFKENGGGDVGLVGGKERGWRGHGEVGLKVGGVFQAGAVTFSPYVHGGYERVVMGKGYMERDVAFAGNENGTGFNVRGTDGGKDQFKAGAGINVGFGPVVLELGYEQSVGGKRDNQMFQGGLSIRW